jgi:hypothetical protein
MNAPRYVVKEIATRWGPRFVAYDTVKPSHVAWVGSRKIAHEVEDRAECERDVAWLNGLGK